MYDKDFIPQGLKSVFGFIGKLIADESANKFAAVKPIESLQNSAIFYGHIKTSGGLINSMDFFLLENGKVKHLYAFMESAQ